MAMQKYLVCIENNTTHTQVLLGKAKASLIILLCFVLKTCHCAENHIHLKKHGPLPRFKSSLRENSCTQSERPPQK